MRLNESELRECHIRYVGDDDDAMWYWVASERSCDGGNLLDASGPHDTRNDAEIDYCERAGYTLHYVLSRAVAAHLYGTEIDEDDEDAEAAAVWLDEQPGYMVAVLDAYDGVCDGCGVFGELNCVVFDEGVGT